MSVRKKLILKEKDAEEENGKGGDRKEIYKKIMEGYEEI